jgi:hypothetical protein
MARGTAAPGVAGRQGSARLANGERRPARGGLLDPWACGVWRWGIRRVDVGARAGEPTVARVPRRPTLGGSHGGRECGVARGRHATELWSAGQNQFHLSFFDRVFLKFLKQK